MGTLGGFLILPGIGDSGPEHWQTRWQRELPGARRVMAADWDHPVRAQWVVALERAVVETTEPARPAGVVAAGGGGAPCGIVLVAHSLGCLQVAHWAATTARAAGVRGALLVAPPDPTGPAFPREAVGFAPLPAGALPFASVLVASADDPYATLAFARAQAATWRSRFVDAGPRGHLNAASGLGDWPEGRALLDEVVASAV